MSKTDRIDKLLLSYARGEYGVVPELGKKGSREYEIMSGIYMIGEELKASTISEEYLKRIINSISDSLIITNPEGNVVEYNESAHKQLGIAEGISLKNILPETWAHYERHQDRIYGDVATEFESTVEYLHGEESPVLVNIHRIPDKHRKRKVLLFLIKNLSTSKALEAEKMLTMISAQEKERARVSKELHDSLGQHLTAVRLQLRVLESKLSDPQAAGKSLNEATGILDASIDELRNICFNLLPSSFLMEDLPTALQNYFKELNLQKLVNLEFSTHGKMFETDSKLNISVLRIAQEFIQNSLKHAECTKIKLILTYNHPVLGVMLEDNGIGFDPDKAMSKSGHGLNNMISRIKALNGRYKLTSGDHGTLLDIVYRITENKNN